MEPGRPSEPRRAIATHCRVSYDRRPCRAHPPTAGCTSAREREPARSLYRSRRTALRYSLPVDCLNGSYDHPPLSDVGPYHAGDQVGDQVGDPAGAGGHAGERLARVRMSRGLYLGESSHRGSPGSHRRIPYRPRGERHEAHRCRRHRRDPRRVQPRRRLARRGSKGQEDRDLHQRRPVQVHRRSHDRIAVEDPGRHLRSQPALRRRARPPGRPPKYSTTCRSR